MRKTQERGFCLKLNGLGAGFSGRFLTRGNYERQLSSTLNDPRSAGIIFPDPEQDTRPITSNLIGRVVFRELMYVAPSEAPQHFGLEIYGDFSRSEVVGYRVLTSMKRSVLQVSKPGPKAPQFRATIHLRLAPWAEFAALR